ncbi:MAG TPA: DUF5667 domain-containing protein [Pseudonocardiaceae bacterium]|nr:DUF5667 domain-containing protein [Pseudonocardiaceae bacterium]
MRTTRASGGPGPERPDYGHDSFVQADHFARAVDRGLRKTSDPALNRELALVTALRQVGAASGPDASERDRMRQRIMAEFPAVVHHGSSPILPLRPSSVRPSSVRPSSVRPSSARPARRHRHALPDQTRSRLVVAAAAALCLLMSLSGMSLLLSHDALPGDPLYTVKRSAESAELGLTFGDERKALKHLEFAGARVSELEMLADQADAAGTWSTEQGRFLRSLQDFELDTTAATRLLTTTVAAGDGQTGALAALSEWAQQQETRLRVVRAALPLAASTRVDSTLELLDRVTARAASLDRRSGCRSISSGAHDDLGVVPATGACESTAPNDTSSAAPLPQRTGPPAVGPVGSLIPPGLLAPPLDAPAPGAGEPAELGLPSTPADVLPAPDQPPGKDPAQPAPGGGSAPVLPVPQPGGIPLLPLLPLENPHVE